MCGGGDSTQVTRTELPLREQQARQFLINAAQDQFQNFTPQFFPQSTVAEPSSLTKAGTEQLATFGQSPFNTELLNQVNANQNFLTGTQNNPLSQFGQFNIGAGAEGVQNPFSSNPNLAPNVATDFAGGVKSPTQNALNSTLNVTPGQNPLVDQLIKNVIGANTKNFQENVLPGIKNTSISNNAFGGSRGQLAEGKAVSGLNDTNAKIAAQIALDAFNSDANRRLQASQIGAGAINAGGQQNLAGLAQGIDVAKLVADALQGGSALGITGASNALQFSPTAQNLNLTGTDRLLQAGNIENQFTQADLNDLVKRFAFEQQQPGIQLAQLNEATSGIPKGIGTETAPGPESGGFAGALGGATAGLALGGQLAPTGSEKTGQIIGALLGALGGGFS